LIQELQTTYRLRPEEQQVLARVHERLSHSSHPLPSPDNVRFDDRTRSPQRVTPGKLPERIAGSRRRWLTRLSALAAAMLVVVLVGSLVLTFSLIHRTGAGSPLGNGFHLVLEPVRGSKPSQTEMQIASEILAQRFSSFGLSGAIVNVVTLTGHLAIQMALPHFGGNEQQTIETLVQTGKLEFWCTGPMPLQTGKQFDPTRYAQYNPGGGPRFTGRDLDPNSLFVSQDQSGRSQINFEMQGSAIASFAKFTASNIGEYLTITFDQKVIESAVIQSTIDGPAVLTGNFTQQQANAIVADLKAGSLTVALMTLR